jgi:hypothetical protein
MQIGDRVRLKERGIASHYQDRPDSRLQGFSTDLDRMPGPKLLLLEYEFDEASVF